MFTTTTTITITMKYQLLTLLIISIILSISLISAAEDYNGEVEEELSLWGKIMSWFRGIFGSNDSSSILKDFDGKVEFYKSTSCDCCGGHSEYLKDQGLDFQIIKMKELSSIKEGYNIPPELRSCHTMILGDYFVEGHMPAEAIEKLITEKPDIAGIALAGMPPGTPGMPGVKSEEWIIYAVNHDRSKYEFMTI